MSDVNHSSTPIRIAIIGAGLTGLVTATLLERRFAALGQTLTIDIFEKSAGVGRLATRYQKPNPKHDKQYQFDFGAQFFTAKTAEFQAFLEPWLQSGVITAWHAKLATVTQKAAAKSDNNGGEANAVMPTESIELTESWSDAQPRYISSPKMTSWGRALAQALTATTLHYKTQVAPLSDSAAENTGAHQTQLFDREGRGLGKFDWVICTAPAKQAAELMVHTGFEGKQAIAEATMLACYTLMLGWQDPVKLPASLAAGNWDILQVESAATAASSRLGRIFVEHHKPQRQHLLPSVTIHAANDWSEQHVDDELTAVTQRLLADAQQLLGWQETTAPNHIDCHRWRYAATLSANLAAKGALIDQQRQWIVSGDWCAEGRIESCYQMAYETTEAIVRLNQLTG